MLLGRITANKGLNCQVRRFSTAIKNINLDSMSLEEHINRYKTKQSASSHMNLNSLPELGNPIHQLNPDLGVTYSPNRGVQMLLNVIGPEQVSAHYENFGMSRRVAITFWAAALSVSCLDANADIINALTSAFESFGFYAMILYTYLEGRKSIALPLLNRFYGHTFRNEITGLYTNFQEDMFAQFRKREAIAREQLEYFDLHKEFKHIKNEAIERFLEAEQSILKEHLNDRARNLLESAKQMENNNQKAITGQVLNNIRAEVAKLRANPGTDLISKSFEAALEGIKLGRMDYKNDGVLDKVLATTKAEIKKVNDLSEEDKNKLLNLSETQLKALKDMDTTAQRDFLKKRPAGLEGALRDNETYAKTMAQW
jgi:hypothetical protein